MASFNSSPGDLPAVPLTLEGAAVLHQMFRVRWPQWKALSAADQSAIAAEATELLGQLERNATGPSAAFATLGHKADLLLVHFRPSFDDLKAIELRLACTRLWDYLEPTHSYVSVVELGLYESSMKTYASLADRGLVPFSEEWTTEIASVVARQKEAMRPRLYPEIPGARYICFYPMDRKRGETRNWYTLPMAERQRQMHEHGTVGRRYAGEVRQIISGSIGFDDWEWGVDLFADDPVIFKKLIYEMRFDEVSAVYALFGQFWVGLRCPAGQLAGLLSGEVPAGGEA
ncbi:MAG: hydrogen peroxide-dependent heme synthase [Bryobacteraceae bacterium]